MAPGALAQAPVEELCDGKLTLRGKVQPGLTGTEKKHLCGAPGSWETLPFNQVRFNLRSFLQSRGYHAPIFSEDVGARRLTVDVGEPLRVTSLVAVGAPVTLRIERKREVVGEILTPSLLGSVEGWVTQRLAADGYGCARVESEANPETGAITLHVTPGQALPLLSVEEDPIPGVSAGMIRRHDAFRLGQLYDGDLLTVTSNRIGSLGLLQANYFTTRCESGGVIAHHEVTAGPPRFLTFGVGVDTEGVVRLKASWRNSRLGTHASLIDASTELSAKEQQATVFLNWYHFPFPSRRHLRPSYRLSHENQNAYEILSTRVGLVMATSWDVRAVGAEFSVGPVLDLVRTLRGSGRLNPNAQFLQLEASLRVRSHGFEYWATDPRAGYMASAVVDLAHESLGSSASAQRVSLIGAALWNYRDYDPPLWVAGVRGGAQTVIASERPGEGSRLPASFFGYLGGSRDLRGFGLQSVPEFGAMTTVFADPEIRYAGIWGIQPLIFVDLGLTGTEPLRLDSRLLYAPGFGLRYKSPIGVFRTTLARGFPLDTPGGWNFYLSFGEEF